MKILIKYLTFCLLVLANFACDVNDSPKSGQARVNFYLVDAPADYDEIWIEVLALRVKANYQDSEMNDNDDSFE